jgi:hypothetical protein
MRDDERAQGGGIVRHWRQAWQGQCLDFLMKMDQRKMVEATFWACAMVCVQDLPDRFMLPTRCWVFCSDLRLSDDVRRCEVQAWAPTYPPPSSSFWVLRHLLLVRRLRFNLCISL